MPVESALNRQQRRNLRCGKTGLLENQTKTWMSISVFLRVSLVGIGTQMVKFSVWNSIVPRMLNSTRAIAFYDQLW